MSKALSTLLNSVNVDKNLPQVLRCMHDKVCLFKYKSGSSPIGIWLLSSGLIFLLKADLCVTSSFDILSV